PFIFVDIKRVPGNSVNKPWVINTTLTPEIRNFFLLFGFRKMYKMSLTIKVYNQISDISREMPIREPTSI
ncbi:MAG: hypothetical protein LIP01_00645, partial [Tannerellaceae bacterium]|nr:hypothetical protein [Tannerellaceae bacterium]